MRALRYIFAASVLASFPTSGLASAKAGGAPPEPPTHGFVYYQPTGILGAVVSGKVGGGATPKPDGFEVRDALAEFRDPATAKKVLAEMKAKAGAPNGKTFALFRYTDSETQGWGMLNMVCGVSKEDRSDDQEVVFDKSIDWSFDDQATMPFAHFKVASRAQKVRSIARCLAKLPGMPTLKPLPPVRVAALHIDDRAYTLGELYLKARDPVGFVGSHEQYRKAFRCLVTRSAQALPEAQGDSVAVRAIKIENEVENYNQETVSIDYSITMLAVMPSSSVDAFFSGADTDAFGGLWATRWGFSDLPTKKGNTMIDQIIGDKEKDIPECRRQAGLLEIPPARIEMPGHTPRCGDFSSPPAARAKHQGLLFARERPETP
jgi:hypothetical protein